MSDPVRAISWGYFGSSPAVQSTSACSPASEPVTRRVCDAVMSSFSSSSSSSSEKPLFPAGTVFEDYKASEESAISFVEPYPIFSPIKVDKEGNTELHTIMKRRHISNLDDYLREVEAILRTGVDPNFQNIEGNTAWHLINNEGWGVYEKLEKVYSIFLKNGTRFDLVNKKGATFLHVLCSRFYSAALLAKEILQAGANPNAKDTQGRTPLHILAMSSSPTLEWIGEILMPAGDESYLATPENSSLPLVIEKKNQIMDLAKEILQAGADPNAKDDQGYTLLHTLAMFSSFAGLEWIGEVLMQGGAEVDLPTPAGDTALHLVVQFKEDPRAITSLLNLKASPNAQNNQGDTPLHLAIRARRDIQLISVLLQSGADVNIQNGEGNTAFHLVGELSGWNDYQASVISLLSQYGPNFDLLNQKQETAAQKIIEKKASFASVQKQREAKEDL